MQGLLRGREVFRNPCKSGKQIAGIYTNGDELAKKESCTQNIRKVVSIKTTNASKMLPNVKKQKKSIIIYSHSIPQICLFMHLIFVPFEKGSIK